MPASLLKIDLDKRKKNTGFIGEGSFIEIL